MDYKVIFNMVLALLGTVVSYLVGDISTVLKVVALFMVLDYITGILVSFKFNKTSSKICKEGIFKKAGIFFVIIMAHQVDLLMPEKYPIVKTMVCYFYVGGEGISILENVGALGVPIPNRLINALEQLKEKKDS